MSQFVKANSPSRKHRTRKIKLLNIHHTKCTTFSDVSCAKSQSVQCSRKPMEDNFGNLMLETVSLAKLDTTMCVALTMLCAICSPCVIRILQKQETCAAIDTPFQPVKMYTCIIPYRYRFIMFKINETICESVKMPHTAALFRFKL